MRRKIVRDSRAEMMRQERRNNRRHRTNYIYQVVIQDEYNNLYHIGFYEKLNDSIKDINDWLKGCYKERLKKNDLKEYASTFDYCFDKEIGESGVMVRGFIFDSNDLKV